MEQYLLSVHGIDDSTPPSAEAMEKMYRDVDLFNDELRASGAWVFAGGLQPANTATVVRTKDGEVVMTDGSFIEGKVHLGGFWVITTPDRETALAWAAKATKACGQPVEVRPFQAEPES